MVNTNKQKKIDVQLASPHTIVLVMLALTALTGFVNQTILSLGIVVGFVLLFVCDKLHVAFPFVLFYNSLYGLVFGMSVLRIYTLLTFLQIIARIPTQKAVKTKYFAPLTVYALFLAFVMMQNNMREAIFLVFDIICCLSVVSRLTENFDALKEFFETYTWVCMCSFMTGWVVGNTIGNEFTYSRFQGTFEDPNYMGFFFTVAVFAIVTLKLFKSKQRIVVIVILYSMILATLSMTAIVMNVIAWIFYLSFAKKISVTSACVLGIAVVSLAFLYLYGLENPETPILGDLSARIDEKYQSLVVGDIDDVTTGRTSLVKNNIEYYLSLPMFNMLFGGISVNPRHLHPDIKAVSHNEYVDLLLNVGVIGAVIMIVFFAFSYWSRIQHYRFENKDRDLCIVMIKTIWVIYAFTLTTFLDFRFMLLFLI